MSLDGRKIINIFFKQGYDRWLTFIITQDPLEHTQAEFWRMIIEQSVHTLVMLSELGDGQRSRCQCYWPTELGHSLTFDYVNVRFDRQTFDQHMCIRNFTLTNLQASLDKISFSKLMLKFTKFNIKFCFCFCLKCLDWSTTTNHSITIACLGKCCCA